MKKHILFVDDEPQILEALQRVLREQSDRWEMTYVDHPADAWEKLLNETYDAVVSDIKMDDMSGLQLLDLIQHTEKTKNIPVVMLTGLDDQSLKQQALELGAIDLLHKPIEPGQLVARLQSVLRLKSYQDSLNASNELLRQTVLDQKCELTKSRLNLVCRLAKAAEHRDEQTGNHVVRVGCYSRAIAEALGLDLASQDALLLSAPLHDIGKIGIPDNILLKPGSLSLEERAKMQEHCVIGEKILREQSKAMAPLLSRYSTESRADDSPDPILETAASIALSHHEKWDGSGYPQKLAGERIPQEARIVAIADVFDALCNERPYKPAYPEEKALQIIRNGAGSHFDPHVYEAFLKALSELRSIRNSYSDDIDMICDTRR